MLTDEGIKERGTHKELMELDGEYAHMVKFTQLTRKVLKCVILIIVITKMLIAVYYCMADYNIWRMTYMEMWDIYDANKEKTGRLMKRMTGSLKMENIILQC